QDVIELLVGDRVSLARGAEHIQVPDAEADMLADRIAEQRLVHLVSRRPWHAHGRQDHPREPCLVRRVGHHAQPAPAAATRARSQSWYSRRRPGMRQVPGSGWSARATSPSGPILASRTAMPSWLILVRAR